MSEQEQGQGASTSNINISGDTVKQALADGVRKGVLLAEQEQTLWWFYCHCRTEGFDLKEAAEHVKTDTSTLYRAWSARNVGNLALVCQEITRYRKEVSQRADNVKLEFVETSTWKIVDKVCNAAAVTNSVAFIWGDSQIGKTETLLEFARRNNHGMTKYVRMPASSGVLLFMQEVARACFVSPDSCFDKLRERVLRAIDANTLLIIDEMHEVFVSYNHGTAVKVMELIREIHDRTRCGLVLVSTNVGRDEIENGKYCKLLEQLRRRGTIKVQLPSHPPKADLDKIARRFGLPPVEGVAYEVVKDMIHTSGLGMYIKFLKSAAKMASNADEKLTWEHFVTAHDIIQKLSQKTKSE